MSKRIMYLRDATYHPVGCIAMVIDRTKERAEYQVSVLNPQDQFDRKTARLLCLERLVDHPITVRITGNGSFHTIAQAVMEDLIKSKCPSRAVRAAKLWMRLNVT